MTESESNGGKPGCVRHRGFLDQWLIEVDEERRLKISAERLQSVRRRLPQPVRDPDERSDRRR